MSYTSKLHEIFTQRLEDWIKNSKQSYVEARELLAIYNFQAAPGGTQVSEFADTPKATKAQIVSALSVLSRFMNMMNLDDQDVVITPENQSENISPFLQ